MADCFSKPGLMPFFEAKQTLLSSVPTVKETQSIKIELADNRVLATDILSPINVPAHDNSAMDGYALRDDQLSSGEGQTLFELVGIAYAGAPFSGSLQNGQCIRIMTGAVVPTGANTVVMQENVEQISNEIGSTIKLTQAAKIDSNIRRAGEDIQQGQTVFNKGHLVKAVDIGLLASLGLAEIGVFRKLKVAVFSTGDELKLPGETLSAGDIYETNSQVLVAMINRMGFEAIPMGIIPDDEQAIEDAFINADLQADAVVSSGGVSVGDADYTKNVLDKLGDINFWKVAIKPGKPFAFGKLKNSVFFGLPGNPVSSAVTFQQLTKPALQAMSGANAVENQIFKVPTTDNVKKVPGRIDFQRGITSIDKNGQMQVTPLSGQGSGILSSVSRANCFIILPQDNAGITKGDLVEVELFDDIIG